MKDWITNQGELPGQILGFASNAALALLIFLIGKWVARRLVDIGKRAALERGIEKTVGGFLSNIVYIALLAMVIIAAMARLGVPTASFIAILGAAGLAIGLALQGSLSNFASGVLLVAFQPCKIGDYIEAGGASGTVTDITVFSTTLVTPDQRTITVPNSSVLSGPIVNYSTSPSRRLDLVIGVSYDADIASVKSLLRDVVEADERVLKAHPVQIGISELADSSMLFTVRPWVSSGDYLSLKFDLHEKIKNAFDLAGIGIPYPQMDINVTTVSESQ
ncbi:MAG: mechanosensitive ion channel domain-containing protein [Granulosicoccaceae bacterium]